MLPKGWKSIALSELQTKTSSVDPRRYPTEMFDLFSVPSYTSDAPECVTGDKIGSVKQEVQSNDILLCKIVPHIRRAWSVPQRTQRRQIASGEWIVFRSDYINSQYLRNFLISDGFHEQFMHTVSGVGGSLMRARPSEAVKISFPLPPLAEQRRIVAKLDSLTARIARARAELERVQQLRGAFTARFLRKIFSAEIKKHFPLSEVITSIDAGKNLKCEERPPKKNEQGIVKVSAVSSEIFRPEEAKTLPQSYLPPERDLITNGDVLLARASGSLKLVGRIAVAERCDGNLYLSDKVLRINIDKTWKDWVVWFLRSPLGREQIESFSSGISMHNIGQNNFKRIKIPFVNFQGREGKISSLIRGLKHINHLETEAQRALTLLNRLESSLLAKAFRGELVPQDPNDEPASVLLDRIRAERAAAPKPKRGRRQSTQDMPLPKKRQTGKHG